MNKKFANRQTVLWRLVPLAVVVVAGLVGCTPDKSEEVTFTPLPKEDQIKRINANTNMTADQKAAAIAKVNGEPEKKPAK